jgi:hypothetical protein
MRHGTTGAYYHRDDTSDLTRIPPFKYLNIERQSPPFISWADNPILRRLTERTKPLPEPADPPGVSRSPCHNLTRFTITDWSPVETSMNDFRSLLARKKPLLMP